MNLPLLTAILIGVYYTFSYAIQCNSGWVPAGSKCYKIRTPKTLNNRTNECSIYAAEFPNELKENLGYSHIVWIKAKGKIKAINLGQQLATTAKNGEYYPLCVEENKSATIELHGYATFEERNWLIPNSKTVIDEMKEFLNNISYFDFVWVGLFSNGSYYWTDGFEFDNYQKNFLNISSANETDGLCGVFSLGTNFTLRNCSDCLSGIAISGTNASKVNTSSKCLSTTTEEQSTPMTTTATEEQSTPMTTTATEEQSTPMTTTATEEQSTPMTTTATEEQSTPMTTTATEEQSTPMKTTATEEQSTLMTTTETNRCWCNSSRNLSQAEFMESIKEIKINKIETSKYKRSKTSAPDERTSSRAIGMVAVAIMVIPFCLIVLSDIPLIMKPLIKYWKRKKASKNIIP